MPPVKEAALRLGLTVHQPERVKRPEIVEQIRAMVPEAIVVVGYGQIIPKSILDIPPRGIINVHASLLPKYRGAAPIQWAIARGETHTGATTMRINEGLDTGDMLLKCGNRDWARRRRLPAWGKFASHTTGADLGGADHAQPSSIGSVLKPQDEAQATYAPILKKEDGRIDWHKPARDILEPHARFRSRPGAYTSLRGQKFQIWKKAAIGEVELLGSGALCGASTSGKLYAGCGEGESIELTEVQLEGKKRMTTAAFLNGFTPAN